MWFSITPHAANQQKEVAVATLLTALHQASSTTCELQLVIEGTGDGTRLLAEVPTSLSSLFAANAADLLPDCRIDRLHETATAEHDFQRVAVLRLTPEFLTLASSSDNANNQVDRSAGLLSALRTGRSGAIQTRLALRIKPAWSKRRDVTRRLIERSSYDLRPAVADRLYQRLIRTRRWPTNFVADAIRRVCISRRQAINDADAKLRSHLFECVIAVEVAGPAAAQRLLITKLTDIVGSLGAFTDDRCQFEAVSLARRNSTGWRDSSVLTPTELSLLWHPPTGTSRVARIARSSILELEPPERNDGDDPNDATTLGRVVYRNRKENVILSPAARMRHAFIVGKTGCGKSTLLQNMIVDDIRGDRAICLLDPHGDLTDTILDFVPKHRTNDVVLLDAGDREHVVGFNPLATGGKLDPVLVADGVLTSFQKVFGFDAGQAPRLLHIFRNCLLALVSHRDDATLISVQRMLVDESFRKSIIYRIKNPAVRQFWIEEFGRWRPADRTAFVASLQNKLGAYLSNPLLAGIFAQPKSRLDFRALMDDGRKIVLINLSKGRMGSDASSLLGSLIVSSLQTAALSRADLPERDRRDFFVYLDEFSSFVSDGNDTFATILSESRKYRTGYTLVTQFVEQLDLQTRAAVFGNCGSLIAMQSGIDDANLLASQLGEPLTPATIATLPRYHAYARLHASAGPSRPFALQTLPPPTLHDRRAAVVRKNALHRYARKRAEVERDIERAYRI